MRIGMELGQYAAQKQVQILAPRMIQSMEILQLPIMSLMERLQLELEKNPVLELKEGSDEGPPVEAEFKGTDSLPPETPPDPERDELVVDEKTAELDFDRLDALSRDYGDFLNEEHRPSRGSMDEEGDRKHEAMQNMASPPESLRQHLEDQLSYLNIPEEQERLVRWIINNYIDRTGYIGLRTTREKAKAAEKERRVSKRKKDERESLEDILKDLEEVFVSVSLEEIASSYDRPVTVAEIEEALNYIQMLDPPGVGARDLKECLLLQVSDDIPHADVVRALIKNHLEDIQHNRLLVIQKKTDFDIEKIKEGIEELKRLNPKPGIAFIEDNNRYIVPDIAVEKREDGTYDIRLLDDWVPDVHISRRYLEMSRDRDADPKTRAYLKKKIQDALWLRESIEQRRNTLLKVTRAIIDHQKDFLDKGPEHVQPLKMQQIADQVGVHVTTVSRAVDDKWVETPRGLFPLKRFFGGASHNKETGEDIAWERIKQKLLELIEKENKRNPLSDEELVDKLKDEGFPIKRRTVTKYRKMLDIPSSRQRKDWALSQEAVHAASVVQPPSPAREEEVSPPLPPAVSPPPLELPPIPAEVAMQEAVE